MGSVTVYYDSKVQELVAMWQEGAAGPLHLMSFGYAGEGGLGLEVARAIDQRVCFLQTSWPASQNGKTLADVRSVVSDTWDRCYIDGFVGRPYSNRTNHESDIPGSIILMYDRTHREAVTIWEDKLIGPIRVATFKETQPGSLQLEIIAATAGTTP
jgi:hypothetical protein